MNSIGFSCFDPYFLRDARFMNNSFVLLIIELHIITYYFYITNDNLPTFQFCVQLLKKKSLHT